MDAEITLQRLRHIRELGFSGAWPGSGRGGSEPCYERGWLRITDGLAAAELDEAASRLTAAETAPARDTAIRGA
jgi:hypothetical protein